MPAAVVFDLDGTLTDPKIGITRSICYGLEQMGRVAPDPETLGWCIGPPLQASLAALLESEEESAACLGHYRERFRTIGMYENSVYEGIGETLELLRSRGHALYVATSKPHFFAVPILEHFGLDGHFSGVFGSELDGTRADKGELLAHVLTSAGLDPSRSLMVGDRSHDLVGARKNGMAFVGVLYGYGSSEELAAADRLIGHPSELGEVVQEMGH